MEKELTKLELDCESIRRDIKECGQLYISVAYKVYELDYYGTYKEKYENIVDCCAAEFGFKKSTVYNMIGIVVKFGEKEKDSRKIGYISLFKYNKFSYSQLTEMLSLSESKREKITPDMTIKKIRDLKKVQTSGKIKSDVKSDVMSLKTIDNTFKLQDSIIPDQPVSESKRENVTPDMTIKEIRDLKKVQTSGKIKSDVKSDVMSLKTIDNTFKLQDSIIPDQPVVITPDQPVVIVDDIVSSSEAPDVEKIKKLDEENKKLKEEIQQLYKMIADYKKENSMLRVKVHQFEKKSDSLLKQSD